MPRGENPNSRANLQKFGSEKDARKEGEKGRAKAKENRKVLKTFQELDAEFTTDAERKKMLDMLKKRAEQGNLKAWELYANYMGMKPVEKISVANVDQEAIDGLKEAIALRRTNGESQQE